MTPGEAKRRHITAILADVGAPLFNGTAPVGTPSPYVLMDELGPEGVRNGMGRTGSHEFYPRIYAEAEGEVYPSAVAAAILGALDQSETTQGEWTVFANLVSDYDDPNVTDEGRQFRREGGDFRLVVRPNPGN
jgi:hypothetical protein